MMTKGKTKDNGDTNTDEAKDRGDKKENIAKK